MTTNTPPPAPETLADQPLALQLAHLVIPSAQSGVDGRTAGKLRSTVIQAARQMERIGWGMHGSIVQMLETPAYRRFWVNPLYPIRYTAAEIGDMASSLALEGQTTALIVQALPDPRPRAQGGTGGDLLIIDGVKRYLAAPRAGMTELRAEVQPFTNIYDATRHAVIGKTSLHVPTELEIGELILAMRYAHRMALMQNPQITNFPTQEELGALLGNVSQPQVSRWLRLAQLPDDALTLLYEGRLSIAQAVELLSAPRERQGALAGEIADATVAPTRDDVRVRVRVERGLRLLPPGKSAQEGAARWLSLDDDAQTHISRPAGLWIDEVATQPAPVAIAQLAHDLDVWLEAALADLDTPPIHARALLRALRAPQIADLINLVASAAATTN